MVVLSSLLLFGALVGLVWVAIQDFKTLKIRNKHVLMLLFLNLAAMATSGHAAAVGSLAAGALLFTLGLLMWQFRLMGAGDAKLYLPIGLMVGWSRLLPFAIFLLLASLLFLAVLRWARRFSADSGGIAQRLRVLAEGRGSPYAVPMTLATILTVLPRVVENLTH